MPLMYVDKLPRELPSFAVLEQESRAFGKDWSIVFAAALSGSGGKSPSSEAAEKPMQDMVEKIKLGKFGTFIPFNRQGEPVTFE